MNSLAQHVSLATLTDAADAVLQNQFFSPKSVVTCDLCNLVLEPFQFSSSPRRPSFCILTSYYLLTSAYTVQRTANFELLYTR